MEERAQDLALYIIENKTTVRAAASRFGISKSTVHTVISIWNGSYGRYNNLLRKMWCRDRTGRTGKDCETEPPGQLTGSAVRAVFALFHNKTEGITVPPD